MKRYIRSDSYELEPEYTGDIQVGDYIYKPGSPYEGTVTDIYYDQNKDDWFLALDTYVSGLRESDCIIKKRDGKYVDHWKTAKARANMIFPKR